MNVALFFHVILSLISSNPDYFTLQSPGAELDTGTSPLSSDPLYLKIRADVRLDPWGESSIPGGALWQ